MSFTEAIFLFGSAAVLGPMVAHLLAKPRYRRVPFTMLQFLRAGQIESQSRRRLRDLLMLLLRCAIIVLIAMLFSRPLVATRQQTEEKRAVHYLGLDNSMSMSYSDGGGSYFEQMVNSAADYIRSAEADGLFNICSLAGGDWVRDLSKESALAEVHKLKIAPRGADMAGFISVLNRTGRKKNPMSEISVFVRSDFTRNALRQLENASEPVLVGKIDCRAVVSPKPVNNAAIIDAHAAGILGGELTVNVTVANYGEVEQSRQVTARVGKNVSEPVNIKLAAGQRGTYPVRIEAVGQGEDELFLPVELNLSGSDGLKADDTFRLGVSLPRQKAINVLFVDSGADEIYLLRTAMASLSRTRRQGEPVGGQGAISIKQVLYNTFNASDLSWANIVVFSGIKPELDNRVRDLREFVAAGGRVVFFMTGKPVYQTAEKLWREGVLAALPRDFIGGKACIKQRVVVAESAVADSDILAVRSLCSYRLDQIVLTGYFDCAAHSESFCPWQLENGVGFVYFRRLGNGTAMLVNTSADDSLGALTKSNACAAFCHYLLGLDSRLGEHSFECDQRVSLPASSTEMRFGGQQEFWVETCNGSKCRATIQESLLSVPNAGGVGWVKTLAKPVRYAGVNLPTGETDMTRPAAGQVSELTARLLRTEPGKITSTAAVAGDKNTKPVWKVFAWIIIGLLLAEPAVANRLKR